jgi:hypothetical protein
MLKRLVLIALVAVACGGPNAGDVSDAGQPLTDAGQPDASQPDAGQPDAGQPDAGQPDAGQADAGTAACRITITGALTTTGICDGVGGVYEITPDAFFADTGASISESGFALQFSAAIHGATGPISFATGDAASWDFGVELPGSQGNWQAGYAGGANPVTGSFQVSYTNSGDPISKGTLGTAYINTHGTIDGIIPPGNNSTAGITVHIDF